MGLASFAVLGVDLKIHERRPYIIEINGLHSGMKGFALAEQLRQQRTTPLPENADENRLLEHLRTMAGPALSYLGGQLLARGDGSDRLGGAELIYQRGPGGRVRYRKAEAIHPSWSRQFDGILEILLATEENLRDKLQTDRAFRGKLRGLKTKSFPATSAGLRAFFATTPPGPYISKPVGEAQGVGYQIHVSRERRAAQRGEGFLVERFVPSDPIRSLTDRKLHDGCMRYVVVVEEGRRGEIQLAHFGGYWRLAPKPMGPVLDIDSTRANLAQHALAEPASDEDLAIVRSMLDEHLPQIYRNLRS